MPGVARPLRVLYLAYDLFSFGGIQRYSRYELRALAELYGAENIRASSLMPRGDSGFGDIDVEVVGDGSKRRFARDVLRSASDVDLVICDHVNLSPIGRAVARRTGARLCVNVYGIEVWGPLLPWRKRGLLAADLVVSDCAFTQRVLERRFPALRGRIQVVRDCVDIDGFTPGEGADFGFNGTPVVLTVSRLAPGRSKGHDVVLRALAESRDFAYAVAGDGGDRDRLEALARDLGVADRVRFLGRVPDEQLAGLYRGCDAFVLASAFKLGRNAEGEGVPLVVLEAQACGKPVVTSNLDGSAESIVDGESGYLVDPHDASAVGAALHRILFDDETRTRMGDAARRSAVEQFSFTVFRDRLGEVLA